MRSRVIVLAAAVVVVAALALNQTAHQAPASTQDTPGVPDGTSRSSIATGSPEAEASSSAGATAALPGSPAPGSRSSLGALVAMLTVAPEHRTGYERSLFVHWIDADGDGCNTRKEVLLAEARRQSFANDLGEPWELIAVSGATNEAKSDDDPADWLPPSASAECPFLERYIGAKARWDLAIDERERDALLREIADCRGAEVAYDPVP